MALVKNTNSYVDLDDTESYFEDRLQADAWVAASEDEQSEALVTAAQILDEQSWAGFSSEEDQDMAFPRTGSYIDRSRGRTISFDSDATEAPKGVREAQMELAFHLLNNEGLLDDTGSVLDLSVGTINLTTVKSASLIPGVVRRKIKPYLINGGARTVRLGG